MNGAYIDCEQVIEQLFAFLDRELDDELSQRIDHHLARCRDCFSRAEFERRLRARLAEAGEAEAPASLRLRTRRLLERF